MTRPRLAIVGRSGQVAHALLAGADNAGVEIIARGRPELDIAEPETIARFLDETEPDLVVNASAYTAVDRAESEPGIAALINDIGVGHLALACRRAGLPLVQLSTDFVFDGEKRSPYVESDPVAPLNVYGVTKAAGEATLRRHLPRHVILRTSWVYSAYGANFVKTMLRLGAERPEIQVVADQQGSPTHARDIAAAILAITPRLLAPDGAAPWGTYHLSGAGETTWHGFAAAIFRRAAARGASVPKLKAIGTADYPTPARRPVYSVLDNSRFGSTFGFQLPDWRDSLDACIGDLLPGAAERHSA